MKHRIAQFSFLGLLFCLALITSSCSSTQKVVYFSDLDSTSLGQLTGANFAEPLIQTDDILSISVQTIDPTSSAALNQVQASSGSQGPGASNITGFLVDRDGFIEMPMLGKVRLAGSTTSEAKEIIRKQASKFYKEPTIQVRFANYKITVLGEVARPASYTMPNEKVTIFDAISLAGDLTIFGKRENIMLIRTLADGKKEIARLDLSSSQLLSSPYFFLKQNDVLYIEPSKGKIATNNAARNQMVSLGVSIAALLFTIVSRL